MKFIKSKNSKMKKMIANINDKNLSSVVDRYLRFVYDQHSFTWLCWRKKYFDMDLTKDEIGLFELKLSFKKSKGYKLRKIDPDNPELQDPTDDINCKVKGVINHDPNDLGVQFGIIDFLPPCLDPSQTEAQRKDP